MKPASDEPVHEVRVLAQPDWSSSGREGSHSGRTAGGRRETWPSPCSIAAEVTAGDALDSAGQSRAGQVGRQPRVVGGRVVCLGRQAHEPLARPAGHGHLDGDLLADPRLERSRLDRGARQAGGQRHELHAHGGVTREVRRVDAQPFGEHVLPVHRQLDVVPAQPVEAELVEQPQRSGRRQPGGEILGAHVVERSRETRPAPPTRRRGAASGAGAPAHTCSTAVPRGAQHHLCRLPAQKSAPRPLEVDRQHARGVGAVDETAVPRSFRAGSSDTSGIRRAVDDVTWSTTVSRVRSVTSWSTAAVTSSSGARSGT